MKEGDVALSPLPQADGQIKNRPVVLLRRMPGFGDWLVCGISTQIHQQAAGFDETIEESHADYRRSGLKAASVVRLGFLEFDVAEQIAFCPDELAGRIAR